MCCGRTSGRRDRGHLPALDEPIDPGITSSVSKVELAMPPIIGTAMRCITSDPVPSFHRIGNSPAVIAVTVIILGRTRSTAPSMMAALLRG